MTTPLEVVIREPKWTAEALVAKFAVGIALLATKAALVLILVPPVAQVFGWDLHPNYGESLLIVLLANILFKTPGIGTYSYSDKNGYLKK